MGYLINSARLHTLTINGIDYTPNLIGWSVQDASAYRNGLITTTGSMVLGSEQGDNFEDYDRNDFLRGAEVVLDVIHADGTVERHPRGLLYVISSAYDPESNSVGVELGCEIAVKKLLDGGEDLFSLAPITLDPAQQDLDNVGNALAANAQFAYQDRNGAIQTATYFGGDGFGVIDPGQFVAVRGTTCLNVSPLAAGSAIPDEVKLSYQFPSDGVASDRQGQIDIVEDISYYFIRYPAPMFKRERADPNGGIEGVVYGDSGGGSITVPNGGYTPSVTTPAGSCGNIPATPDYSPGGGGGGGGSGSTVPTSCNDGLQTVEAVEYVPAVRRSRSVTEYNGPAAQVSKAATYLEGPALEANSQYYADAFAYCTGTYATECNPQGGCEMAGLNQMDLGRTETIYFYEPTSNQLVKTIADTYRPTLSAAQPSDWRSGNNRGIPQDFKSDLSTSAQYLHQRVVTEYEKTDNANTQTTTTFTSQAARGGGIGGGELHAERGGIKTRNIRKATSIVTLDLRPDSVNAATTSVTAASTLFNLNSNFGGYSQFGKYTLEEDMPVPLLFEGEGYKADVTNAVDKYGRYLTSFVEGDARGLEIAEALRQDMTTDWAPNMAFRYYDPHKGRLMAMRMDAATWSVSPEGSLVVINGIWISDLEGTVTIPSNLTGDATPDMTGDTPGAPSGPGAGPSVSGEAVTGQRMQFNVEVHIPITMTLTPSSADGVRPGPPSAETFTNKLTLVVFCSGLLVQPGALVTHDTDGSLPADNATDPVVDSSLVLNADLFAGQ